MRGPLRDVRGVKRCRDTDDDVGSEEFRAVVRAYSDGVLDFRGADFPHNGMDFEGQIDVLRAAVPHQFELAIRWNEADGAVAVEFGELYALVELAVFECHATCCCSGGFSRARDVAYGSGIGA